MLEHFEVVCHFAEQPPHPADVRHADRRGHHEQGARKPDRGPSTVNGYASLSVVSADPESSLSAGLSERGSLAISVL